jgi:phage tail sheath gpL-like
MAQNNISLAAARGNFLTWCISGYLPLAELCRPLYIGQALTTTVPAGEFKIIYSVQEARDVFGAGSVLALMAIQHFCTCPELPLYCAPIADDPLGVKAEYTLTITGPATDHGELSVAILDQAYSIGVIAGMTATSIATNLAAQLSKNVDLPFVVTVTGAVLSLVPKNSGPVGNWFVPVWNPNFGDRFPDGVTVSQTQSQVGSGIVDIVPVLPVMNCAWDCIALGTENEIAVDAIVAAVRLNWRCGVQGDFKGGHLFHGRTDTAALIAGYARGRNNPEECIVPVRANYKYPSYLLAAAMTSRACCTACTTPTRPVQYDNGILGCLYDSRQCSSIWSAAEKKSFYDAGVVNWDVANARGVRTTVLWIEEPLTSYKYDPNTGASDGAWQRVESRYTTAKFVRDLGNWYRRNYSSVALLSDGTKLPVGMRAVTPRLLQAAILSWLRGTQLGFTTEATPQQLERMVRVERTNAPNNCDPNRVNVLIDLDLINQLSRIATTIDVSPEFACISPVATAA